MGMVKQAFHALIFGFPAALSFEAVEWGSLSLFLQIYASFRKFKRRRNKTIWSGDRDGGCVFKKVTDYD